MDEKIFTYLDAISDAYKENVEIVSGLHHDLQDTLRTIEFYSNDRYLSGNIDDLGMEKPFFNICNFRVTVAKTATDLDVKDIKFEADSLKYSVQNMLINRELFQYLKESNFSLLLNEMGYTRPKYGGVILKKTMKKGKLDISIVEFTNAEFDPSDVLGGAFIETHHMQPSEFAQMDDVWKNVKETLAAHAKYHKNKPMKVVIKEMTGDFPEYYMADVPETADNQSKYKGICSYIAVVNKKKFLLYQEYADVKDKYKYLPWQKMSKRGLGRGVIEDGFDAQWATNDSMLSIKKAMMLSGRVGVITDSQKLSGNILTDHDNGKIYQIEQGRTATSMNLGATNLPEYHNVIDMWEKQYNNAASTYDANTGEAPPSGTTLGQTQLLNAVANSPFEFRREEAGIFLNEVLNDWIFPHLKKKILQDHNLVADYTNDELDLIDEAIATFDSNNIVKEKMLNNEAVYEPDRQAIKAALKNSLQVHANKREVKIPKGFLDVEGKITANITGELKNKAASLQSLDNMIAKYMSTFNPATGTFAASEDPYISTLMNTAIEVLGVPKMPVKKAAPAPMPAQPPVEEIPQKPLSVKQPQAVA